MHQRYRERKEKGMVRLDGEKIISKQFDGLTGEEAYESNDDYDEKALEARRKALVEEIADIDELLKDIKELRTLREKNEISRI